MVENNEEGNFSGSIGDDHKNKPWEREIIETLAFTAINEQRRTRRWSIFFKSLFFLYMVAVLIAAISPFSDDSATVGTSHTAVVDVIGIISEGSDAGADNIIKGLRSAVEANGTKGIILRMNTPGGTPVQASYVYDEIRRIKQKNPDLPIIAVVSDMCASGGYYIASAADKIFVARSSLIGSIGVIMNGFGFVDTMKKLGIERRLVIAGEHKAIADPFSPVSIDEKKHIQGLLNTVHQQFIDAVRQGRGDRLKDDPTIFSGLVWSGEDGIDLGLADAIGSVDSVARDEIGVEKIINYTPKERLIDRLVGQISTAFVSVFWKSAYSISAL